MKEGMVTIGCLQVIFSGIIVILLFDQNLGIIKADNFVT